jgi:predicted flap endonuclease-1-like 5' DNA nuclease
MTDTQAPEERLLESLREIRASLDLSKLEGVGPRAKPLAAELTILLGAAMSLASALADCTIEDCVLLPAACAAWSSAALDSIARSLQVASRYARSEALPATDRCEIARALPAPGGRL